MTAGPTPPRPPTPPEPPRRSPAERRRPLDTRGEPRSVHGVRSRAVETMREARESLSRQLQELDPDLLVELTVGLRGPGRREADWHDSWRDAFNDNGHFEDLWIDLSSLPEARSAPQDPESGAVG